MKNEDKSKNITCRIFTLVIQNETREMVKTRLEDLMGTCEVYAIIHDRDFKKDNPTEKTAIHTHYLVICKTPRKISTIANYFGVDSNQIVLGRSRKNLMLYLTHKNKPDKAQYTCEEVMTNSKPYELEIKKDEITDQEITEMIVNGRVKELVGIVPSHRLTSNLQVVHYGLEKEVYNEVRELKIQMEEIQDTVEEVRKTYDALLLAIESLPSQISGTLLGFASQLGHDINTIEVKSSSGKTKKIKTR